MASTQTVKSRSIVRSRDVHRAASLSIAIHLLILSLWLGGHSFGLWRSAWKRPTRISEMAFQLPQQLLNPASNTDKETEEQGPDPILTFVELDPAQMADKAPEDAQFYGAVNTVAANPKTGNDPVSPRLEGTQTEYVKITQNKNGQLTVPQPAPRETTISQIEAKPAAPAKPDDNKLAEQKPPPPAAEAAKPAPPQESTKDNNLEVASVTEPKPMEAEQKPNESVRRDKLSQGVVDLPTRQSDRVVQLASGNLNDKTSDLPALPSAEQLKQERELDKIIELASTKPLLPSETVAKEFGTAAENPAERQDDSAEVAYARKNDYEETFDPQKDASGTAAPTRPRTLVEVPRGTPGEQTALGGGVQRYDISTSLNAKGTILGDYDQRLVAAVRNKWDMLLATASTLRPGKVVMDFRIHADGRVSEVKVRETNVGEIQALFCQQAILDPAPYLPWPMAMRNQLKSSSRDVTFTFYYMSP